MPKVMEAQSSDANALTSLDEASVKVCVGFAGQLARQYERRSIRVGLEPHKFSEQSTVDID